MVRRWLSLLLLTIAVIGVSFAILGDWIPLLRGPTWVAGEWRWPYLLRPFQRWWLPMVAALLLLTVATMWLLLRVNRRFFTWLTLLTLVLAALLLQLSLIYADRPAVLAELVDRTLAEQTSGYYRAAATTEDLGSLLSNYPAAMPQFESEHVRTHPPGLIIADWLLIRLLDNMPGLSKTVSSRVIPMRCTDLWLMDQPNNVIAGLLLSALVPLLMATATIPLTYLAARQMTNEKAARLAALLAATLPALLLFSPLADQLLAFLGVAALYCLILAIKKSYTGLFYLTGLILAAASFITFGALALLALSLLLSIVLTRRSTVLAESYQRHLRWLLGLLLGFATPWLLYWILFGVNPWDMASVAIDQHYLLVTSQRPYGTWIGFNLLDLVLFTGIVVTVGFFTAAVRGIWDVRQRRFSIVGCLALALIVVLAGLLLSGTTRGEVGRIWLFLMPLMAIPAASLFERRMPDRRAVILLVGLQLLMVLALGLAWKPVEAVIVVAQRPTKPPVPEALVWLGNDFEAPITLAGYRLEADALEAGQKVELTLAWVARGAAQRPFTVFTHVVDQGGHIVAQQDHWPVQGQWPPTCWMDGEEIFDQVTIQLPESLPTGEYRLMVGLYDASDGSRLPVVGGGDSIDLESLVIN